MRRRKLVFYAFLVGVVSGMENGCFSSNEADRWPCPANGIVRHDTGLCTCEEKDPLDRLMISQNQSPCAACNSQDGNGKACICEDGQLLTSNFVQCVDCPADCDTMECVPPGCSSKCTTPPPGCLSGSTCNAEGECVECELGMCGGACGACPYGYLCIDGLCQAGTLCCLPDDPGSFCSRAADFCILPAYGYPPGTPCYCNVLNSDSTTYCTTQINGNLAGYNGTCP